MQENVHECQGTLRRWSPPLLRRSPTFLLLILALRFHTATLLPPAFVVLLLLLPSFLTNSLTISRQFSSHQTLAPARHPRTAHTVRRIHGTMQMSLVGHERPLPSQSLPPWPSLSFRGRAQLPMLSSHLTDRTSLAFMLGPRGAAGPSSPPTVGVPACEYLKSGKDLAVKRSSVTGET